MERCDGFAWMCGRACVRAAANSMDQGLPKPCIMMQLVATGVAACPCVLSELCDVRLCENLFDLSLKTSRVFFFVFFWGGG